MFKTIIAGALMASMSCIALADTPAGADLLSQDFSAPKGQILIIQSGADFYDRCLAFMVFMETKVVGDNDQLVKETTCLSYVNGFRDGHELGSVVNAMREPGATPGHYDFDKFNAFCIPTSVTLGELIDKAMHYLSDHPEKRPRPASLVLRSAWGEAYPCPAPKP